MADPIDLDILDTVTGGSTVKIKTDKPPKLDKEFIATKPKGRRPADIATIQDGLEQAFTFLGMGLSMVNMYDAMVIHENAELMARQWTKVAEQNPKVKKWLLNMMQGGTWAGAISVTLAVTVPILVNHDLAPEELNRMANNIITIPDDEVKQASDRMALQRSSENGNGSPPS